MDSTHEPIYSSREDDPKAETEICEFIVGLAEKVDRLQDLEVAGDLAGLEKQTQKLAKRARDLGYPMLAEIAFLLMEVARENKPESAQQALVELTEVAQRVRRGYRGAA